MSASASGRFVILVGRMTSYSAEINAINDHAAAAVAEFLIETPQLFHSVFREVDESFDILDVTATGEAVS